MSSALILLPVLCFAFVCRLTEVVAVVDNGLDGVTNAEDEVTLTYTVTNTGNTCLGNIVVDDPSAGTLQCTAEHSGMGTPATSPKKSTIKK